MPIIPSLSRHRTFFHIVRVDTHGILARTGTGSQYRAKSNVTMANKLNNQDPIDIGECGLNVRKVIQNREGKPKSRINMESPAKMARGASKAAP